MRRLPRRMRMPSSMVIVARASVIFVRSGPIFTPPPSMARQASVVGLGPAQEHDQIAHEDLAPP